MEQIKRVGVDTSKHVFTVHGVDEKDRPVLRRNLKRSTFLEMFAKLPPTKVALEACGASHHWGRALQALGHEVALIPPQYVKPFVKRSKNDRNDAEAISEAAARPGMAQVPVKSAEQQASAMLLSVRELLSRQRTQLVNALRGHAAEFGLVTAKGDKGVADLLEAASQRLPAMAGEALALLGGQIGRVEQELKLADAKLQTQHRASEVSKRLEQVPALVSIRPSMSSPCMGLTRRIGRCCGAISSAARFSKCSLNCRQQKWRSKRVARRIIGGARCRRWAMRWR